MITWLASYPRSGNTLCRIRLKSLFDISTVSIHGDFKVIASDPKVAKVVGHQEWPEGRSVDELRDAAEMYYVKTHTPQERDGDKVIYLLRDGRDCSASFYLYLRNINRERVRLLDVIRGNTFAGTWSGHLEEWNPLESDSVLLLKFEDMVRNPLETCQALASFLGRDVDRLQLPTFDELHDLSPKFFRKGQIGGWEKVLTKKALSLFWEVNGDAMRRYGYSD